MRTPVTTAWLAEKLKAELLGPGDILISSLAPLERAGEGALSFIRSPQYASRWPDSRASAAVITRSIRIPDHDPTRRALLVVDDADLAMIAALELFAPSAPPQAPGVHPSACVHPTARIGHGVSIGPNCCIGPASSVGDGARLAAGVTIGDGVSIGRACVLHPGVVIQDRCVLGDACILHPGVVIGADGFGYRPAPDGRGLVKIPHIGNVVIGNGVEIGANSCIDRAKFDSTVIGDGTKIDNLVQIGHNCRIGRACIICGLAGLAGSVTLGDGVTIAGGVLIADNLTIGDGAVIAGASAVMEDVPAGETWFGYPATRHRDYLRSVLVLRELTLNLSAIRSLLRHGKKR
jgi:UDP-3-O-[3-hydroxymyristoyl] glucosamine N-acyltransferase